jgi:hypothetical protein
MERSNRMTARTFDDLQKRIDDWTYDMLNDDDKMQAWVEERNTLNKLNAYIGFPAGNRYPIERIPGEKQIALDELFGVS